MNHLISPPSNCYPEWHIDHSYPSDHGFWNLESSMKTGRFMRMMTTNKEKCAGSLRFDLLCNKWRSSLSPSSEHEDDYDGEEGEGGKGFEEEYRVRGWWWWAGRGVNGWASFWEHIDHSDQSQQRQKGIGQRKVCSSFPSCWGPPSPPLKHDGLRWRTNVCFSWLDNDA